MTDTNVIQFRPKPRRGNPPKQAVACMKQAAKLLEEVNALMDQADKLCFDAGVYPPDWHVRNRPGPVRA